MSRASLAIAVLVLAGCGTPVEPAPAPSAAPSQVVKVTRGPTESPTSEPIQRNVRAGAFCSPEGARGTTKAGTRVRCSSTPTDDQARWRKDG
jgi:hypothetical protein